MLDWSDQICQRYTGVSLFLISSLNTLAPIEGLILSSRSLAVQGQAFVQYVPRLIGLGPLEKLQHAPAGRQIDDRGVDVRVVESPQLQQNPIDPAHVFEVGQSFTEELDRVIVPTPELQPAAVPSLARGFALRLSHGLSPQPRAVAGSVSNRPSPV